VRGRAVLLTLAGLLAVGVSGAAAAERNVSIKNNTFTPHRVIAVTDDSVKWTNNEVFAGRNHTVTSDTAALFDSPTLGLGGVFTHTFALHGVYSYHCAIHPFMHGVVAVYDLYFTAPASVVFGKTAAVSGYAVENSSVTIKRLNGGSPVVVTTVGANVTTGRFTASLPAVPDEYWAEDGARTSAHIKIAVKPKLTVKSRKKGKARWITVSTNPSQTGGKMLLERKKGHSWKKLATHTLGAGSKTVFKVVPTAKMHVRLRLSAPVGGYAKTTSGTLTLRP
jgi:plastocyanin